MKRFLLTTLLFAILAATPAFAEESIPSTEIKSYFLVLMEQKYVPSRFSPFNWEDGKTPHTLVYVIGTSNGRELFIFPAPNTENKWMSPKEAEKQNQILRRKFQETF